jgi:fused signal recognition particle receptor
MSLFNYREKPGYFSRLKDALKTTKDDLTYKINELTGTSDSPITSDQIDELEAILVSADIGVQTTMEIVERIEEETRGNRFITSHQVKRLIREELNTILKSVGDPESGQNGGKPRVIFVVGVNGVGKTTTIGKLAHLYKVEGQSVAFSASDTFRAAAIEQINIWGERTGCQVIRQAQGSDPAAVLFDAIAASRARGIDVLIVDTAGRIHTKSNLMQELEKMRRVAAREVEAAPHEVFLVLDATTGQNGLIQAREFLKSSGVTGLIVTKLDGTAKGGIIVAIAKELSIPIRFIGVGEKVEDLLPFDPEAFVETIL